MKLKARTVVLAVVILMVLALATTSAAQANGGPTPPPWAPAPVPPGCEIHNLGTQEALICGAAPGKPLIIYAHGYAQVQPRGSAWNMNPDEVAIMVGTIPTVLDLGFAFAAPSYSKLGYAIGVAEADITALIMAYAGLYGPPAGIIMTGASEGGIITAMMVEKHPELFAGGLAMCGPVGGMPYQVRYLGDFYVLFDGLFSPVFTYPPVLGADFGLQTPPIPADAYAYWDPDNDLSPYDMDYIGLISQAIARDFKTNWGRSTRTIFSATGAPSDYLFWKPEAYIPTAVQALYFSIWGANDMLATAGGQPYDSNHLQSRYPFAEDITQTHAWYLYQAYQTTGNLQRPLVTLHTTRDPQVPVQHEIIYAGLANNNLATLIIPRYGHCNFTTTEIEVALAVLMLKILIAPAASMTTLSADQVAPLEAALDHSNGHAYGLANGNGNGQARGHSVEHRLRQLGIAEVSLEGLGTGADAIEVLEGMAR